MRRPLVHAAAAAALLLVLDVRVGHAQAQDEGQRGILDRLLTLRSASPKPLVDLAGPQRRLAALDLQLLTRDDMDVRVNVSCDRDRHRYAGGGAHEHRRIQAALNARLDLHRAARWTVSLYGALGFRADKVQSRHGGVLSATRWGRLDLRRRGLHASAGLALDGAIADGWRLRVAAALLDARHQAHRERLIGQVHRRTATGASVRLRPAVSLLGAF